VSRNVAQCTIICAIASWILLSLLSPWVLSDKNTFLFNFISQGGFLSFLGVVVTITLASTANLHLELNKLEEKINKRIFNNTRLAVKKSAYSLIGMLLVAIFLSSVKSLVCNSEISEAFLNGACILIVLFNILVLIDLTQTAFCLEPNIQE
jgi:hypothetical protein